MHNAKPHTVELSLEQKKAAESPHGTHIIVAGPGSGKTRVLTERIAYLGESLGVRAEKILAITFTNKAADEMRDRLEKRLAGIPRIQTFHALAHDVLRAHARAAGLPPDFTLAGDEKNASASAITFDALLEKTRELLFEHEEIRTVWQNKFGHILVDEYQDTDDAQADILKILAQKHGNLFAIGDPDQAIYGFRGANVRRFLSFFEECPSAREHVLNTNYRSSGTIVAAADALIKHNSERIEKISKSADEAGAPLTRVSLPTARAEAHFIVREIQKLIGGTEYEYLDRTEREREYHFSDIAVVYRLNAVGRFLRETFDSAAIPYHVVEPERTLEEKVDWRTVRRNVVTLMSVHAAKGLEFPVVFITGAEEGVFPYTKKGVDIEEERRLFYVAMTRARELLYLSHAAKRPLFGALGPRDPSRFIVEIPEKFVQKREPKTKKRPSQERLF